jgi:hypothetical protein
MRRAALLLGWLCAAGCWGPSSAPEAALEAAADGEGGPDLPGKWSKLRPRAREELDAGQRAEIAALEALGYADGTVPARTERVVTVHDRARAVQGLNLYASGHAAEATLTDMDGAVLHTWKTTWAQAFPSSKLPSGAPGTNHWRRVKLLPEGGLLGIFEGRGLVRLARDGGLVWALSNHAHHDLARVGADQLWVLTREADVLPAYDARRPVLQDFVETRTLDGALVGRFSLLEAMLDSPFADQVPAPGGARDGDLFHTNSIEVLDGSLAAAHPAFAAGNLLVSMRNLDRIGVVDARTHRFVWVGNASGADRFARQHDAHALAPDRVALFDNQGGGRGARAMIYALPGLTRVWSWEGAPDDPLRSATLGTVQALSGGNLLITESEGGRALEVTPSGDVVWEMYNPHRAGANGEFIAALFEVVRLAPEEVPWLARGAGDRADL